MKENVAFGISFVTGILLCTWTGALAGHYLVPDPNVWYAFPAIMSTAVCSIAVGAGSGLACFRFAVGKNDG